MLKPGSPDGGRVKETSGPDRQPVQRGAPTDLWSDTPPLEVHEGGPTATVQDNDRIRIDALGKTPLPYKWTKAELAGSSWATQTSRPKSNQRGFVPVCPNSYPSPPGMRYCRSAR